LRLLAAQLYPGGIFGLWSDDPPAVEFLQSLNSVFAEAESHIVKFHNPLLDCESASTVYVARTSPAGAAPVTVLQATGDVTPPEDIPDPKS